MPVSFEALQASEKAFVERVCEGLWNSFMAELQPLAIYGDGSASPNGEKFAAVLEGASVRVVFDFNKGYCYHTAVQLPVEES